MSTKSTIAYGASFHLYEEVFDDEFVHLHLEGVPFEASQDFVTVSIPVHVWEVIRKHPGVDLSLANCSDEEIRGRVERAVDERLERCREMEDGSPGRRMAGLFGLLPYGPVESPREEQIGRGMEHFLGLRERQRQIRQAIEELEAEQKRRR